MSQDLPQISEECQEREIPTEESMAGYNSYYFHCNSYQGRSNYAVCQHTIDAVLERDMTLRSSCPVAIKNGTCPALKMRIAEKNAGRALFFEDRRERARILEEQVKAGSSVVQYGKPRTHASDWTPTDTTRLSPQTSSPTRAASTAKPAARKPNNDETIDRNIADRNLLADAIDNMMENNK